MRNEKEMTYLLGVQDMADGIYDYVQKCREDGETDLRSILHEIKGVRAELVAKQQGSFRPQEVEQ